MAKNQANYPASLDVLNTDRVAGQVITSDSYDVIEDAITEIEAELRRVTTKTATGTLTTAEGGLVNVSAATAYILYLPTAVGNAGLEYIILKTDNNANLITIDADGTETINGALTFTGLNYQWACAGFKSDGANWVIKAKVFYPAQDKLSAFAATTSAELAGVISDETGTDKLVYNTSPTLVTPTLGAANATSINLTGGQIAFPATQNASAGANTLDDYEEGTWTIGVSFGGGTTGITYIANTGYYTKIGNLVTISGYLELYNKGSSTGAAVITGLPFTVVNNIAGFTSVALWLSEITFANQYQGYAFKNTTTINLDEITEAGATTSLTNADFVNTSAIIVNCTYRVE